MKKRILFVDDEPNILRGLQRSLRGLREKWDMHFVDQAENALDLLDDSVFDVIVTDMRMPGMNGLQLLNRVQKTHPMMVRIILSGHSDQEAIMKSVKSAHQYLSKPCDKKNLIEAVDRSCSLRDLLASVSLKTVLGGIDSVSCLPSLYTQIMEGLKSNKSSSVEIGQIIAKDVGMSAKILQLINSSFFGMPSHVANLTEAVVILGIDVIKTLVLNIEVFSQFDEQAMTILPIKKINDHCNRTGVIARQIAKAEQMTKETLDEAMISGLLHDIGKLLLVEYYPDEYQRVMEMVKGKKISFHEAEQAVFGTSHAEIGGYFLSLWGLPDNIVEGVAFHHMPEQSKSQNFALCGIVHVADLMEKHEKIMPGQWASLTGLSVQYMERLKLSDRILLWRDYLNIQ